MSECSRPPQTMAIPWSHSLLTSSASLTSCSIPSQLSTLSFMIVENRLSRSLAPTLGPVSPVAVVCAVVDVAGVECLRSWFSRCDADGVSGALWVDERRVGRVLGFEAACVGRVGRA